MGLVSAIAWGLGWRQLGGQGLMCSVELEEERNKNGREKRKVGFDEEERRKVM